MLEIKNLTKIFNLDQAPEFRKLALDDISLTIEDGEFVTIIGGNGSGKSTLMNMISGVYSPTSGSIIIDGIDVTNKPEYERAKYLGRVFQDPMMGTAGNMSISENLELAIRRGEKRTLRWGFKKENEEIFIKTLSGLNLGLEDRLTHKVGLLSGGQRQAVTLVMATLKKPKLLLLDEHTAALDPKTASKVLDLTCRVVEENKLTTLMITHNMKDAIKYGDRLIMFDSGHIVFDIKGEEKKNLTIEQLLKKFDNDSSIVLDDNLLLSK